MYIVSVFEEPRRWSGL